MGCAYLVKIKILSPTLLSYEFCPRLCSTIGRKVINKLCGFTATQNYIESLSLFKISLRWQWDLVGTHSAFWFLGCTILSFPGKEWRPGAPRQAELVLEGTLNVCQVSLLQNTSATCQNTLSPKVFLHSSIAFMLGKWQFLFLQQQCCIDPFIIWSEKKNGLKQCEIYWAVMIHWQ